MPRSTKANADLNRQRLFDEAKQQFAAKGFHGTSIASIAGELGLTKQTLLHHFGSKEQLFSEVLNELALSLSGYVDLLNQTEPDPLERFVKFMLRSLGEQPGAETQIVIRELLENGERAAVAQHWHLQSYLESLVAMVRAVPEKESLSTAEAFAFVYQILGATSYFRISQPTLQGMFGKKELKAIQGSFETQIAAYIRGFCEA